VTLIVSAAANGVAFQVSDRLVSLHHRGLLTAYDDMANKNVVVIARDALLTIGYTGVAYLRAVPTDRFMAEAVAGTAVKGMGLGSHDFGTAHEVTMRVQRALEAEFSARNLWRHSHSVAIAGLIGGKPNHRRLEPILWELRHVGGGPNVFEVIRHERKPFDWARQYALFTVGQDDARTLQSARPRLRAVDRSSETDFRDVLVDVVKETALRAPGVGRDCMAIMLRLDKSADQVVVDVEYVPDVASAVTIDRSGQVELTFVPAYTPYVLSPWGTFSPAVAKSYGPDGGWTVGRLRYRIRTSELPLPGPRSIFFGSQDRRPAP
jgi:hypothetical protein